MKVTLLDFSSAHHIIGCGTNKESEGNKIPIGFAGNFSIHWNAIKWDHDHHNSNKNNLMRDNFNEESEYLVVRVRVELFASFRQRNSEECKYFFRDQYFKWQNLWKWGVIFITSNIVKRKERFYFNDYELEHYVPVERQVRFRSFKNP